MTVDAPVLTPFDMLPNPAKGSILRHRLREASLYWLWLPGGVIGSGMAIDRLLQWHRLVPSTVAFAAAIVLLTTGLGLIFRASYDLAHAGMGTPSPARPCRRLVVTGSYRLCRHPMFLGYDLAALGILLFVGSPAALLVSYPAMLAWQIRFLRREEHVLALRFAGEYRVYRSTVPFLLPLLPPRPR